MKPIIIHNCLDLPWEGKGQTHFHLHIATPPKPTIVLLWTFFVPLMVRIDFAPQKASKWMRTVCLINLSPCYTVFEAENSFLTLCPATLSYQGFAVIKNDNINIL